jgi:hypothetical protein
VSYKYGLKPVTEQPRLKLRDYLTSDIPTVADLKFPFGHASLITPEMFGNDEFGDCWPASAVEGIRLLTAGQGKEANFTTETVLQLYSDVTGFKADDPSTDEGTDVHEGFQFWQNTGVTDADGNVHKVIDYVGLTPGDWNEMLVALSIFDVVYWGFQVPDYAQQQFTDGQPFSLLPGRHSIVGGHAVAIVEAQSPTLADAFCWGGKAGITAPFYSAMSMVAVVAITPDMFTDGKTLDGIDSAKLQADLPAFDTGNVSLKALKGKKAVDIDAVKLLRDDPEKYFSDAESTD